MAQAEQGTHDWTGRTVHGRDGTKLGTLTEVFPPGASGESGTWGVVRSSLGRRRLIPLDGASADEGGGLEVPVDKATLRTAPRASADAPDPETETALTRHYRSRRVLADAQLRQHERYGGMKLGAAFFGWLVAIGLTVLLAGVAAGIAAAVGNSAGATPGTLAGDAASTGIISALVALAVMLVAYYAGGYVAGRLARFDGARNGFFTWLIGVLVTVVAAIVAAVAGSQYNVFTQVQLPAVPVSAEQLTVGGILTLAAIVIGTLLVAVLGGKAGERFHHKVDRAAFESA
jgi:hypothetical protein